MIKVYFDPQPNQFPPRGGVRTHLVKLYHHLSQQPEIRLVTNPNDADILHVESAWRIPRTDRKRPSVHVNHGGFLPSPIPNVIYNLENSDVIVSVSKWVVDKFFPKYHNKTKVIYNGVDLEDFQKDSDLILKDFVLYAKEWNYHFNDFLTLAKQRQDIQFVTTVWPDHLPLFKNVVYIGLQTQVQIINYLKKASCLLLTGSEVCPTMLLEAWACKTPVLARNIDGSRELMLKEGKAVGGWLYEDIGNSGLDKVIENKTALGKQGYTEVVNHYQWNMLTQKYVEIYKACL